MQRVQHSRKQFALGKVSKFHHAGLPHLNFNFKFWLLYAISFLCLLWRRPTEFAPPAFRPQCAVLIFFKIFSSTILSRKLSKPVIKDNYEKTVSFQRKSIPTKNMFSDVEDTKVKSSDVCPLSSRCSNRDIGNSDDLTNSFHRCFFCFICFLHISILQIRVLSP